MDVFTAARQLMNPEGRRDPYPLYAALRAAGPVLTLGDQVFVTSYEHADAVLRDPRMRVADRQLLARRFGADGPNRPARSLLADSVLSMNAPDHRRMRQVLSGAFTPRRVAALRGAIRAQATRLADAMAGHAMPGDAMPGDAMPGDATVVRPAGPLDFMAHFAVPLPVGVICDLLGVPGPDRAWFRAVALDFAEIVEPAITAEAAERADRVVTSTGDSPAGNVKLLNNYLVNSGTPQTRNGASVAAIPYAYTVDANNSVKSIVTSGAGTGKV